MKHRYLLLFFLLLLGSLTAQAQTRYEAENAATNADITRTSPPVASGTGYVDYLTEPGKYVRFAVSVPSAGAYTLEARYAAALTSTRTMSVLVDGRLQQQAAYAPTGGWQSWATQTSTLYLPAGTHTVQYLYDEADNGWINLDYLLVRSATYQAENAQLNAASVGTYWGGYTGSGFAENLTQQGASSVTFAVTVPTSGYYALETRYAAAGTRGETMSVYVNGTDVGQAGFPRA